MYRSPTRKFLAFALLAIFVLCNTPTNVLHALFANHKDQKTELIANHGLPEVSATGIDCHCNSNVVTAPFLSGSCELKILIAKSFNDYQERLIAFTHSREVLTTALRGPPELS